MNREQFDRFEKLIGQLQGVFDELSLLSKKSPSDAVNAFKLKFINKLLEHANDFLGDYRPFDDFLTFDIDALPQSSDVIFVLSQYLQCFEKLRADNCENYLGNWYIVLEDGNRVRTARPRRLRE